MNKMNLYGFAIGAVRLFYSLCFNIKVEGTENIPQKNGFVAVCNHKSNFDPPLVAVALPRKLTFMAKEELFDIKPLGFVIKKLGAFPIKRGSGDLGAIRLTLSLLKDEKNILIFPEGTRCKEKGKLLEGKQGAALIAYKANVPIVPIGINGEYGFRKKITVKFGKPIILSEHIEGRASSEVLKKATDGLIMPEIAELCGAEYSYGD